MQINRHLFLCYFPHYQPIPRRNRTAQPLPPLQPKEIIARGAAPPRGGSTRPDEATQRSATTATAQRNHRSGSAARQGSGAPLPTRAAAFGVTLPLTYILLPPVFRPYISTQTSSRIALKTIITAHRPLFTLD